MLDGDRQHQSPVAEHILPDKVPRPLIDHIRLPKAWAKRTTLVDAWPGTVEGVRLSDHSAVVIEINGVAGGQSSAKKSESTRFNS